MVTTVTIMASDPAVRPRQPRSDPHPRGNPRQDPVLELIRQKLDGRDKANHQVFDAPSVEELGGVLAEVSADPDRRPDLVQIIGHGQPGMLSLGYHFTGRFNDGPRGPYYVLDSDPNVYAVLDEPMKADAEVLLLGCSVGDGSVGPQPLVADGATLVFDLGRMWKCRVSAPAELISAADFDDQGNFKSRDLLLSVKGLEFTAPRPATNMASAAPRPSILVTSVRWAMGGEPVEVSATSSTELAGIFNQEVQLPAVLALPEVFFETTVDGQSLSAELIGNGRVLRVNFSDGARHFSATPSELPRLRLLIRELLQPGYKPSVSSTYLTTA